MARPGTPEYDAAMTSFAKFLAVQLVREWRQEQRTESKAQKQEERQHTAPEVGGLVSWRMRFQVGQRVWLNQIDVRVKEIRLDGIVLRHVRRTGAANYYFNEREVTALVAEGRLRAFKESRS
jgi:hypothetical protein